MNNSALTIFGTAGAPSTQARRTTGKGDFSLFGFVVSLEGTTALDISHYKHSGFARLRKAQCRFNSTFFSQSMRQTEIRRQTLLPSGMFSPESKDTPVPLAL